MTTAVALSENRQKRASSRMRSPHEHARSRRHFLGGITSASFAVGASINAPSFAFNLSFTNRAAGSTRLEMSGSSNTVSNLAYKTVSLNLPTFSAQVPVACWFPASESSFSKIPIRSQACYEHRISVRRIGELLAGWDFIPEFASRSFSFKPTTPSGTLLNGESLPFPSGSKVIILSHGFLGSRFDLSHIAEELASRGFVCLSPEYPESLAASYRRAPGLDRKVVNDELLKFVQNAIKPTGYGVVGHSLGCGTALSLGDSTWARVLIAGPPAPLDSPSPVLFITSMNDVFVRSRGPAAAFAIPSSSKYERLEEGRLPITLPKQAALIFDRPNAPNHISYLSENVNDAMVSFLSPLLPVAQALSIPVLDFDTYKVARDAKPTGEIIKPLISDFLVQHLALKATY